MKALECTQEDYYRTANEAERNAVRALLFQYTCAGVEQIGPRSIAEFQLEIMDCIYWFQLEAVKCEIEKWIERSI